MRRVVALLLLLTLAPACRDASPDEEAARARIVASAAATRAERSSGISVAVDETQGSGSGQQRGGGTDVGRFRGDGVIDYRSGAAQLSFDLGESASPLLGQGRGEIRAVDGVFFVRVPGVDVGGKAWIKVDPNGLTQGALEAAGIDTALGTDPTALLDLLAGARQARPIGSDTVRGVRTRQYTAAIDVQRAAREADGAARAAIERLAEDVAGGRLPVEVWLDDEGRVRRAKLPVVRRASAQEPEPPRVTTTLELFDFGTPVSVTAPPSGEVVDPAGAGR